MLVVPLSGGHRSSREDSNRLLGHHVGMVDGDLDFAHALVDEAAVISTRRFRRRDWEVEAKSDGSPVTDVDRQVESALRELIHRRFPSDSIIGEEYGGDRGEGRCWYLDPIDGTTAFCEGRDRWSTLVALAEGNGVLLGLVDFPMLRRRVWAGLGTGAFDNGTRLHVSHLGQLSESTICDDYRHHIERKVPDHPLVQLAALAGNVFPHRGLAPLVVASGQAEVALGSEGGPWDYAPFVAIVREAGGRTSDVFGEDRFDGRTLLSTNGYVHEETLAALRDGTSIRGGDA
jgi:histidinol-phosphatase